MSGRRGAALLVLLAAAAGLWLHLRRERLAANLAGIESLMDQTVEDARSEGAGPALASLGARLSGGGEATAGLAASSAPASPRPEPPTAAAQPTPLRAARVSRPTLPGQKRQLTTPGCCHGAWWAPDGSRLLFVDRPPGAPGAALYGVSVWPPGAAAEVVDAKVAQAGGTERLRLRPEGAYTFVRDLETGEEWPLPTGGNPVRVAPDASRVVWWDAHGGRQGVDGLIRITASDIYGQDPQVVSALWGATVVGFLPDSRNVIALGRPIKERALYALVALDLETGGMRELSRGEWLSDALISPDGRWVAYMTSLDRRHPERNGVWVVPVDATGPDEALKLGEDGAFRWRAPDQLVYVPMRPGEAQHEVWAFDPKSGASSKLVGQEAGLRIAGNDWTISPEGASMAWVDESDRALWILDLPEDGASRP